MHSALVMTVLVGFALMLDGDKSATQVFKSANHLFFVTFFDGIRHDWTRGTQLLNRQGSDLRHLHEIEQKLSHNLDLDSLDHTLLHQITMLVAQKW